MRNSRAIIFGVVFSVFSFVAYGQVEKYQAAYIYNFTRYLEWPDDYKTGNFVIGIIGKSSSLSSELSNMAASKRVSGRPIEVKEFANSASLGRCNILFVADSQVKQLPEILKATSGMSVLIVTSSNNGLENGAGLNFLIIDSKLQFEMKKSNITERNIAVSQALEQLALNKY